MNTLTIFSWSIRRNCCWCIFGRKAGNTVPAGDVVTPAWLCPPAQRAAATSQFHSITLAQAIGLFCGEESNFLSQSV